MKLLRVGQVGMERPALLDEQGALRDLSSLVTDIDGALLADAPALERIRAAAAAGELPRLDPAGLRTGRVQA
ncbi:fumarylacetoacetate hydrolase family protein, partial [Streptomyces rimosus]